jgi:hypothetical protein
MGYPETFEGFQINSQKNWSDFKKQEVRKENLAHASNSKKKKRERERETEKRMFANIIYPV